MPCKEASTERYSDVHNGRCAVCVIISYHGWNGKDDSNPGGKLLSALVALRYAGVSKELIIRFNDSGTTFDVIADHLDRNNVLANSKQ